MALYWLTSTDSGATLAAGVNGNLCTIWDWILNTKAGLTIAFTGTNARIYQMSNGDLIYLKHDSSVSGAANLAIVRLVESATSISSFTDPSPTVAQVADGSCNIIMSTTASATTRNWWALVDTTLHFFYFFVAGSQASGSAINIDGGYIWAGGTSELASDSYNSLTYNRNTTNTTAATNALFNAAVQTSSNIAQQAFHFKRTRDGTIKSTLGCLGPYQGSTNPSMANGPVYPDPDDGKLRIVKAFATDGYSTTTTIGTAAEQCRMYLPRLFFGSHVTSGYSGINIADTFTASAYDATTDAFVFFPCGAASGTVGAVMLQKAGTWVRPSL